MLRMLPAARRERDRRAPERQRAAGGGDAAAPLDADGPHGGSRRRARRRDLRLARRPPPPRRRRPRRGQGRASRPRCPAATAARPRRPAPATGLDLDALIAAWDTVVARGREQGSFLGAALAACEPSQHRRQRRAPAAHRARTRCTGEALDRAVGRRWTRSSRRSPGPPRAGARWRPRPPPRRARERLTEEGVARRTAAARSGRRIRRSTWRPPCWTSRCSSSGAGCPNMKAPVLCSLTAT